VHYTVRARIIGKLRATIELALRRRGEPALAVGQHDLHVADIDPVEVDDRVAPSSVFLVTSCHAHRAPEDGGLHPLESMGSLATTYGVVGMSQDALARAGGSHPRAGRRAIGHVDSLRSRADRAETYRIIGRTQEALARCSGGAMAGFGA
jgi:hypothetical protein